MPGLTGDSGLTGLSGLIGGYIDRVLGYGPIAYWPLNETSGSTANCLVNSAQDGTYTGVTLADALGPDGVNYAPLWSGGDYVNVYTAAFNGVLDGDEATFMIWCKVANVGVWTDGSYRRGLLFQVDASNYNTISRDGANNGALLWEYRGSGAADRVNNIDTGSTLDWFHMAYTVSVSNNEFKAYLDGSQVGATQVGIAAYAGNLDANNTTIGRNGVVGGSPWSGWLQHCAVWDSVLTQPQIANLATI